MTDGVDAGAGVPSQPATPVDDDRPGTAGPGRQGHLGLAALVAGAGVIHLAMVPSHLDASAVDGVGFFVAGWLQIGLAALLAVRAGARALRAAVVVNLALIAAWAVSRSAGLPVGAHAGDAEDPSLVDGLCVTLEVAAVVVAAMLLLRPALAALRAPTVAFAGGLIALVLVTAALASPSARDHAGAGHGHGAEDDLGFAALQNGQMGDHEHAEGEAAGAGEGSPAPAELAPEEAGELAGQLARTASLVGKYPTIAEAREAGYRQAGPFSPGLGTHYSRFSEGTGNPDGVMDPADIAEPILIFDGLDDDARLAGFMYMAYQETEPEGFAGPLDRWHYHTSVCMVQTPDGIETPFGADLTGVTEEMCNDVGGTLLEFTGYMVHVWTVPGYESDLGTFSDLNPRLTCPDGTYHAVPVSQAAGRDSLCENP